MKKLILLLFTIIFIGSVQAQVTEAEGDLKKRKKDTINGWKKGGTISLNLSQVSLTNWAAGGQNSISANGLISLYATYKKDKSLWENYFDFGYGVLKQGKNGNWWKTDDKIDITSKYGYKAFSNLYYAALVNFKTQFTEGFNYPDDSTKISNFLAPAYLVGAIGMDYKPNDNFTAFLAPITAKMTFVNDQTLANAGAFGVDPAEYDGTGNLIKEGKKSRSEFGGYMRFFYKKDLMENINLQTKLDLFSNYLENPQNFDISWEVLISMKVNKFISATLSTHLLYDDDVDIVVDEQADGTPILGKRVQFKEVIGVGFTYKF